MMRKKRTFLLIAIIAVAGSLYACKKQDSGMTKTTDSKEQMVSEKENISPDDTEKNKSEMEMTDGMQSTEKKEESTTNGAERNQTVD